jgi:colanic acid biosynthesis glycosyl transferase WcaI
VKILILGLNFAPEKVGIAIYTKGLAEALADYGHEVRVVAGQPYYPGWKVLEGHSAFAYSIQNAAGVRVTRVPHYVPARPTGTKRLLHHASFALSAAFPMMTQALTWRPDLVVSVAPSLAAAPLAHCAALLCGGKSWLHLHDFEVEAAFATGLLRRGSVLAELALRFERKVLVSFDSVSSISRAMCRRLMQKGVEATRIFEFGNWADIERVRPLERQSPFRELWKIDTPHVALYSGNIANKQGAEILIGAAQLLSLRRDLTFVICGDGPMRATLEAMAAGLPNVKFRDLQPAEQLGDLLGLASVHLLPQVAGAADLVLPSKLANMLASGRPVVATAEPGTGLYEEMQGVGLTVAPGDFKAFTAAIGRLLDDPALAVEMGQAARRRAEERWSKARVLAGMLDHVAVMSGGKAAPHLQPAALDHANGP